LRPPPPILPLSTTSPPIVTSAKTQRLLDSMPRSLAEAAVLASPSQIARHSSSLPSSSTTPSPQLAHPSQQHQLTGTRLDTQYIPNILPTLNIHDDEPQDDDSGKIKMSQQQPPPPLDRAMIELLDPTLICLLTDPKAEQDRMDSKNSEDYKWDPAELLNLQDDYPYD